MRLSELNAYSNIVIQCHDNPDPDTVGAGYALYKYFKYHNKDVRLIYSGNLEITKSNMLMLIKEFNIPLEYVEKIDVEGLLITVDCQYGAGNVTKFNAKDIAIIDHHQPEAESEAISKTEIKNFLASACTVVWELLCKENFDVNEDIGVSTSLYYGLFTDSGGFSEIYHPLDKDMQENLRVDHSVIRRLKNCVLTLPELEIAGMALIRHSYNPVNKFVVVKTQACDPNILGFISDLALQVDSVNVCVVYNEIKGGIKFSVRSCVREVMANELAIFLAEGMGSAGGHIEKAGGFIKRKEFNNRHAYFNADEYFLRRLTSYYTSFDVIDSTKDKVSIEEMALYKKKPIVVGFVQMIDSVPNNTPIIVRTLEGDLELLVTEDLFVMIGIKGEVYPITKEKFKKSYSVLEGKYDLELEYFPSIRNKQDGTIIYLNQYAKKCISKGESYIYTRPLEKAVKVFTAWDREKYMYGKVGDYLAVRKDDCQDIYIIERDIFYKSYEPTIVK